jgi:hypothetical protein
LIGGRRLNRRKLVLAENLTHDLQSTRERRIAEGLLAFSLAFLSDVATSGFSGLTSSVWALASARASAPMVSLARCMLALRSEKIKANRAEFRALGPCCASSSIRSWQPHVRIHLLRTGLPGFLLLLAAFFAAFPPRNLPQGVQNHAAVIFGMIFISCFVNPALETPVAVVGVGFVYGYLLALRAGAQARAFAAAVGLVRPDPSVPTLGTCRA